MHPKPCGLRIARFSVKLGTKFDSRATMDACGLCRGEVEACGLGSTRFSVNLSRKVGYRGEVEACGRCSIGKVQANRLCSTSPRTNLVIGRKSRREMEACWTFRVQGLVPISVRSLIVDAKWRPVDFAVQGLLPTVVRALVFEVGWGPVNCAIQGLSTKLNTKAAHNARLWAL